MDYIGLVITVLSALFFAMKNPWERKIKKTNLSFGLLGVLLLSIGLFISGYTIYETNEEKVSYKNQLDTIDITVQKTFSTTNQGFENLLKEYEVKTGQLINSFTDNYNILISTIIDQSDSTLNAQLLKIKLDFQKINTEYLIEKDITQRYYFSEAWPYSDKKMDISGEMFFFIPIDISGLVTGIDRYIIWYLIEKNGTFPFSQIESLQEEIRNNLHPMSFGVSNNLQRLELLGVIKPDYWENNVEFTDNFVIRLGIYNEYKNTDDYVKEMLNLNMKNR